MRKQLRIGDIAIDQTFNHNISIKGVSKWYTSRSYIQLICTDGTVFEAHLNSIADARLFVRQVNKHLSTINVKSLSGLIVDQVIVDEIN